MGTTSWSPPHPPHLPVGEDHTLHPSTGVRGSSGGPPLPSPTALLAWGPSGPGDTSMLGSGALWLRAGEEERLWCLPGRQLL